MPFHIVQKTKNGLVDINVIFNLFENVQLGQLSRIQNITFLSVFELYTRALREYFLQYVYFYMVKSLCNNNNVCLQFINFLNNSRLKYDTPRYIFKLFISKLVHASSQ